MLLYGDSYDLFLLKFCLLQVTTDLVGSQLSYVMDGYDLSLSNFVPALVNLLS